MSSTRLPALSRAMCGVLLLCAGGGLQSAAAQSSPAADPRFAPAAERAHEEGDKVFKWIMINGSLPKRAGQASAAEPAASAAPVARRPPTPKPHNAVATAVPHERPALNNRKAAAQAEAASAPAAGASAALAQGGAPAAASSPLPPVPEADPASASASAPVVATAQEPQDQEPQEDEPLILVQEVEPDFPVAIVRRQQKGSVQVRFDVETDGSVTHPEVLKSSNPRLNPAALEAVSQWRFQPLQHKQSGTVELAFDVR